MSVADDVQGLRLVAYTLDGARRGAPVRSLEQKWYSKRGDIPTLTVSRSELQEQPEVLRGEAEVAVEVWDGTRWVEPPGGRFVAVEDGWERLTDGSRTHSLSLTGWVGRLRRATVKPGAAPLVEGKRVFNSVSAGAMLATLLSEAKGAGAFPSLAWDFTPAADSAGRAWSVKLTRHVDPGHDLWSVLQNLHDTGIVDFRTEGRTLRVFNADGAGAVDRTTGSAPVWLRDLSMASSPEKTVYADLVTHVTVYGDEGRHWTFTNGNASTLDRREVALQAGGVKDEATAAQMAQPYLVGGLNPSQQYTREWTQGAPGVPWLPGLVIQPGDWVLADTIEGHRQRMRVADVSLRSRGDEPVTAFVTLGSVRDDILTRLAKRQKGLEGGAGVAAGGRPNPTQDADTIPAAPTGLLGSSDPYLDQDGRQRASITASWTPVTTDVNGVPTEVSRYQLEWAAMLAVDSRSTITEVVADTSSGRSAKVTIQGTGSASVGGVSAEVTLKSTGVDVGAGWVAISPAVYTGDEWKFAQPVTWHTLLTEQPRGTIPDLEPGNAYAVRVRAIAREGGVSAPSEHIVVVAARDNTPPLVPEPPTLESKLGFVIVTTSHKGAGGATQPPDYAGVVVYVDGVEVATIPKGLPDWAFEAVTGQTYVVQLASIDNAGNRSELCTPVSVVGKSVASDQEIADYVDKIVKAGVEGVSFDGLTTYSASAASGTGKALGATWYQIKAGTVTAWWRWDGSAWVAQTLAETFLPKVNIGSGTYGSLSGQRLEAYTVTAEKVLIGSTANVLANGDLSAPTTEPWDAAAFTRRTDGAPGGYAGYLQTTRGSIPVPHSQWIDVPAGAKLAFECWTASTTDMQVTLGLVAPDGSPAGVVETTPLYPGELASSVAGTNRLINRRIPSPWNRISCVYRVNDGVTRVRLGALEHPDGSILWLGGMRLRLMNAGELVVDGSITTPKLAVGAVEANNISAGAVTGIKISADALNFKSAQGLQLTSPLIQTSAYGSRGLKLTGDSFLGYSSNGTERINLNGATGTASFGGGTLTIDGPSGNLSAGRGMLTVDSYSGTITMGRGTLVIDGNSGSLSMRGVFRSGNYPGFPHVEINDQLWGGHSGIRFWSNSAWSEQPEIRATTAQWDRYSAGSLIMTSGQQSNYAQSRAYLVASYGQFTALAVDNSRYRVAEIRGDYQGTALSLWGRDAEITLHGGINLYANNGEIVLKSSRNRIIFSGLPSTSIASNVYIDTNSGVLHLTSSESVLKLDREPIGLEAARALLEVTPVTWRDRAQVEADPDTDRRWPGLLVEDVEAVSARHGGALDELITPASPDGYRGLAYDRVAAYLLPLVRDLSDRLDRLETRHAR